MHKCYRITESRLKFSTLCIQICNIDKIISNAVVKKLKNHLWYLTPETVVLAFFDRNVSIQIKRKMVDQKFCFFEAKNPVVTLTDYRKHTDPEALLQFDLPDFVSHKTNFFFSSFEVCTDFFEVDPSERENNEEYQTASDFCRKLFVVNDFAERHIKFMKDYNRVLTHDVDQLQLILQVVESYRQKYPSHKKSTLTDKPQV